MRDLNVYKDQCLEDMTKLSADVLTEGCRQLGLWGIQSRTAFEWMSYLTEEVGELADAINKHEYSELNRQVGSSSDHVKEEAIQVATLAFKIAEMYDKLKGLK